MIEIKFKNRKLNLDKLLSYGFEKVNDEYVFITDLIDGQMKLTIKVDNNEKIYTEIIDSESNEEYILHRVSAATGSFVGRVKNEYEAIIEDISLKCFESEVFKSEQAKAVIAYVWDTYGDELEFLWQKFPNNAIFRRKDNHKWYAAILTVSRKKIGLNKDELVEILDLRINPKEIENIVDNVRYFTGYHMNKRNWITICLDGTVGIDEICRRIDESYVIAEKY